MNAADTAIAYARAQIGKRYVWATAGPNTFDCSGLVYAAFKSAGINLGRTTYQQIYNGTSVNKADLKPGDLVFPDPGHVQIYVGNGQIIEAANPSVPIRQTAMWGFWRARRVTTPGTGTAGTAIEPVGLSTEPVGITSDIKALIDSFKKVSEVAAWVSDIHNIRRIQMTAFGVFLIIIGLLKWQVFTDVATTATKVAIKAKGG